MHELILLFLGAYALHASASPALPLPPAIPPPPSPPTFPPIGNVGGSAGPSLPNASPPGDISPPLLLTSVPGVADATALPSVPGITPPSGIETPGVGAPPEFPPLSGLPIPSAEVPTLTSIGGVIPTPDLPTGLGSPDLPTSAFPPLPTLTDSALISDIASALSGITLPTSLPAVDPLPTELPMSYTSSLTGLISPLPLPPAVTGAAGSTNPTSIVTNLASAIEILLLLIRLIQETINTGGVRVPGVAELGIEVGTNLLNVLLKVAGELLDKAEAVGAVAF